MPSLYVVRGRDQGKLFTLESAMTTIGRDLHCTVQLTDSEASRNHAEIREEAGRYTLVDLNSSNGTQVNGQNTERAVLKSGDRIQIGQTMLIFTGSGSPDSVPAAHSVDIVQQSQQPDYSRIVSSWASGQIVFQGSSSSLPRSEKAQPSPPPIQEPSSLDSAPDSRSLDVMYQTAIAVGRTVDIPELLQRILRLVFDWVEADRGCIMLLDQESGELRPAARCDRTPTTNPRQNSEVDRISISRTILDFVMEQREGVRTTDAKEDDRWDAGQSIVQLGTREALCVPLLGRYDCVGALYVDTYSSPGEIAKRQQTSRFNDEHLRLMIAIGHQAALAIEDTYYYSSLLQSERLAAIGQTIAILSHHIKNILQGMRGGSYLIGAGLQRNDPEAVRKGWKAVEKNQERISHLVLDMLSYSKDRQPELVVGDFNTTIQDVVDLMQDRAEEQNCRLLWNHQSAIPDAYFDPEGIHRAILNLLTNALDAVQETEQAQIEIRLGYSADEGWWIEVEDNGPGIPAEDQTKVFSLFESRKGNRGTGLGLPVTQKIIAEHGGQITLKPKAGLGCLFRITLPHRSPAESADPPADSLDTLHGEWE